MAGGSDSGSGPRWPSPILKRSLRLKALPWRSPYALNNGMPWRLGANSAWWGDKPAVIWLLCWGDMLAAEAGVPTMPWQDLVWTQFEKRAQKAGITRHPVPKREATAVPGRLEAPPQAPLAPDSRVPQSETIYLRATPEPVAPVAEPEQPPPPAGPVYTADRRKSEGGESSSDRPSPESLRPPDAPPAAVRSTPASPVLSPPAAAVPEPERRSWSPSDFPDTHKAFVPVSERTVVVAPPPSPKSSSSGSSLSFMA